VQLTIFQVPCHFFASSAESAPELPPHPVSRQTSSKSHRSRMKLGEIFISDFVDS
jgi:hypothetical protein